jgi:hypothetical protein
MSDHALLDQFGENMGDRVPLDLSTEYDSPEQARASWAMIIPLSYKPLDKVNYNANI